MEFTNNPRRFRIVKTENISLGFIYMDSKVLEFFKNDKKSENFIINDKPVTENSKNVFLFQFK